MSKSSRLKTIKGVNGKMFYQASVIIFIMWSSGFEMDVLCKRNTQPAFYANTLMNYKKNIMKAPISYINVLPVKEIPVWTYDIREL